MPKEPAEMVVFANMWKPQGVKEILRYTEVQMNGSRDRDQTYRCEFNSSITDTSAVTKTVKGHTALFSRTNSVPTAWFSKTKWLCKFLGIKLTDTEKTKQKCATWYREWEIEERGSVRWGTITIFSSGGECPTHTPTLTLSLSLYLPLPYVIFISSLHELAQISNISDSWQQASRQKRWGRTEVHTVQAEELLGASESVS